MPFAAGLLLGRENRAKDHYYFLFTEPLAFAVHIVQSPGTKTLHYSIHLGFQHEETEKVDHGGISGCMG